MEETARRFATQTGGRVKRQNRLQTALPGIYLLLNIWVNIHAANPIASNAVTTDATVAIKAIIFLSL
jgi:hypothetical protein